MDFRCSIFICLLKGVLVLHLKGVSRGADQIGHLEEWPVHLLILWWPVF